jgi:hypothetical protein
MPAAWRGVAPFHDGLRVAWASSSALRANSIALACPEYRSSRFPTVTRSWLSNAPEEYR